MFSKRIHIHDHLILPFGAARKSDLQKIKLTSVAANGIYITSDVPCLYIDKAKKLPLMMSSFRALSFSENHFPDIDLYDNVIGMLNFIRLLIRNHMPKETTTHFEIAFLDYYFEWVKKTEIIYAAQPARFANALLPIPQMQIYVHDPLEDDWSGRFEPTNNFRVDFGFWTGTQLIAVEIDGKEPEGYERDVRRDRLLRRAEVDVVHILNTEIERHGIKVISELLPKPITFDWLMQPTPDVPFRPI
jgi:hypothetical protein